jgi:hypothetical protein
MVLCFQISNRASQGGFTKLNHWQVTLSDPVPITRVIKATATPISIDQHSRKNA